jgi:hypothetical protein
MGLSVICVVVLAFGGVVRMICGRIERRRGGIPSNIENTRYWEFAVSGPEDASHGIERGDNTF